ncbi:MAG TPA: GNAT family N-acetyltransferase [Casimicrobiaceae bacterium]|nr:GNAT family N-acetyltransferase [Casimicrobiaceae bacterium]
MSTAGNVRDVPFTLRSAVPGDAGAVLALVRELADYERLTQLCVATEEDIARALFGSRRYAEVLLAARNEEVIGFALFFHNFSTFLGRPGVWLEDLFVRPAHRRQGCGRALLKAVAAIARERGCGRFEWAVLDWNASAIAFYESLGATVLPDWRIVRVVGEPLQRLAASGQSPGAALIES